MNYRKRLVNEYADLKEKARKLDNYLYENMDRSMTDDEYKKFKLMEEQLDVMNNYLDILIRRILLEMGEE